MTSYIFIIETIPIITKLRRILIY